jgi:hypothetical protein
MFHPFSTARCDIAVFSIVLNFGGWPDSGVKSVQLVYLFLSCYDSFEHQG